MFQSKFAYVLCAGALFGSMAQVDAMPLSCPVSMNNVQHYYMRFQEGLVNEDVARLVPLLQFPIRINAQNSRVVENAAEFKQLSPSLFQSATFQKLKAQPFSASHVVCRNDQVGLANGALWANLQYGQLKTMAINLGDQTTLQPAAFQGIVIAPMTSSQQFKLFTQHVPSYRYTMHRSHVYHADINNDGQKEWVVVSTCGGSLCTSQIQAIYNAQFKPMSLKPLMHTRQYLQLAKPFLTQADGVVYFSFMTQTPEADYRYRWRNGRVVRMP